MSDFINWLSKEIEKRGWSRNEFGRKIGRTSAGVSHVMTGQTAPTWDFCFGVAQAFNMPPETIFRRAGLLSNTPGKPEKLQQINDLLTHLDKDDLDEVLAYAQLRYERAKKQSS